jgi:hypothetical protein
MSERGVRTHQLKTWPAYFEAVRRREKTFEVRRDDRGGFQVGDHLLLDEWDPETEQYTGRSKTVTVSYVLPGGQFGVEAGYCVLGFR